MYCRSCNLDFPLETYIHLMDEDLESRLLNTRCDRL
ncbi:MAG: dual CXXC motif small (seleno)protein [Thermodesulfobacteriota bacterium]